MRTTITIVIMLISAAIFAQDESSWNYNFSYLHEYPLMTASPVSTGELPASASTEFQARGWTTGIDKTVLLKHYLKINAGVNFSGKTYFRNGQIVDSPLYSSRQLSASHYYLSSPITIQYTKGKIVRPSLTLEPGFQVFNRLPPNQPNYFARQMPGNFLKIMPGVEIRVSDRINLFVGASFTNYNFFGQGGGKWGGGFQIGVKINLRHRKRQKN